MSHYYTKKELYHQIGLIRKHVFKCSESEYPFPLAKWITEINGVAFKTLPFKTKALRAMAYIAEDFSQNHVVLVNNSLSEYEQNFYCGHELIHLCCHKNERSKVFKCYDSIMPNQDPFLEWQANEGAAEFMVPYKILLQKIKDRIDAIDSFSDIHFFKLELANEFLVTEKVMELRLENLKYEIAQYINGVELENIVLMSRKEQKKRKISVLSLNDIENQMFENELRKWKNSRIVS